MITSPQPDPIDTLLNRISIEAEAEYTPQLATFLQRAIARTVDTIIVLAAAYGVQNILTGFILKDNTQNLGFILESVKQATPAFGLMIYSLLYSPLLEATGGTLGKRLVRIKLVENGKPQLAPFRNYMARSVIYLIFFVLSAPFLMCLETVSKEPTTWNFTKTFIALLFAPGFLSCMAFFISNNKQTWHDKIANVMCVKK